MHSVAKTDVGLCRSMNQDVVYASDRAVGPLPNLYIVADGMGGERAGDVASMKTVQLITEYLKRAKGNPLRALNDAILAANYEIYKMAVSNPDYYGMGSTCVACCCIDGVLYIANVGDSRMYLIQENEINQITRDHSYVEEMIRLGKLTRDSEDYRKFKNYVTRGMGGDRSVEADFFKFDIRKGDMVLLCSDGLSNMLSDEMIFDTIRLADSLEEAAEDLINAANKNGGRDNISVVLISDLESEETI